MMHGILNIKEVRNSCTILFADPNERERFEEADR
jgi:hypothetical protein